MRDSAKRNERLTAGALPTARVRLPDGWAGAVMLRDGQGHDLDAGQWEDLAGVIRALPERAAHVFKQQGPRWVAADRWSFGEHKVAVVVKHHVEPDGLPGAVRLLNRSRAARNFTMACKLLRAGVTVPWPLAALERVRDGRRESLFVAEQIPGAVELHAWVQDWTTGRRRVEPTQRRILARRIGAMFAALEHAGWWHRDAKAGNFLVVPSDEGLRIALVDLDGLRPILPWDRAARLRGPAKLAATLMWSGRITATDAARAMRAYDRGRNVSAGRIDRSLAYRLWQRAVAERLTTFMLAAGSTDRPARGAGRPAQAPRQSGGG